MHLRFIQKRFTRDTTLASPLKYPSKKAYGPNKKRIQKVWPQERLSLEYWTATFISVMKEWIDARRSVQTPVSIPQDSARVNMLFPYGFCWMSIVIQPCSTVFRVTNCNGERRTRGGGSEVARQPAASLLSADLRHTTPPCQCHATTTLLLSRGNRESTVRKFKIFIRCVCG